MCKDQQLECRIPRSSCVSIPKHLYTPPPPAADTHTEPGTDKEGFFPEQLAFAFPISSISGGGGILMPKYLTCRLVTSNPWTNYLLGPLIGVECPRHIVHPSSPGHKCSYGLLWNSFGCCSCTCILLRIACRRGYLNFATVLLTAY